jgi:hypothetical protein
MFSEFVGARVSQVKVNRDVENEWFWLKEVETMLF